MPYKLGTRPKAPIGTCGHPTWRKDHMCRSCYLAETRKTIRHCQDCGVPLPRRGNDGAQRCRDCYMKQHRAPHTVCQVANCGEPHFGKGFCRKHYYREWQAANRPSRTSAKVALAKFPCQLCGYDRLRSRIHRLNPSLGYVVGNMVALCSRCHDEVHYGLTLPPVALETTTTRL